MEDSQPLESKPPARPLQPFITPGGRIGRRAALLGLALAAAAAGLYFGWDWVAAAGLAPIVLALAPCAAMCALGLCAHRLGRKDE